MKELQNKTPLVSIEEINVLDSSLQKLYITIPVNKNDSHPLLAFIHKNYQVKNRFNRPDPMCVILASVINACLTQGVTEFLLSRSILGDLIKNDPNIPNRNTIDWQTFNRFFAKMKKPLHGKPLLIEKVAPSKVGGTKARSGVYEILIKEVIDVVENKSLDYLTINRIMEMDQKNNGTRGIVKKEKNIEEENEYEIDDQDENMIEKYFKDLREGSK